MALNLCSKLLWLCRGPSRHLPLSFVFYNAENGILNVWWSTRLTTAVVVVGAAPHCLLELLELIIQPPIKPRKNDNCTPFPMVTAQL